MGLPIVGREEESRTFSSEEWQGTAKAVHVLNVFALDAQHLREGLELAHVISVDEELVEPLGVTWIGGAINFEFDGSAAAACGWRVEILLTSGPSIQLFLPQK